MVQTLSTMFLTVSLFSSTLFLYIGFVYVPILCSGKCLNQTIGHVLLPQRPRPNRPSRVESSVVHSTFGKCCSFFFSIQFYHVLSWSYVNHRYLIS